VDLLDAGGEQALDRAVDVVALRIAAAQAASQNVIGAPPATRGAWIRRG
jgi:hypothetical protein